jgi:hypothetical protein
MSRIVTIKDICYLIAVVAGSTSTTTSKIFKIKFNKNKSQQGFGDHGFAQGRYLR